MSRAELLMATMQESYVRLRNRIEGLTDDEFFWQPVQNSWTIYEDTPGHWTYHYAIPEPKPAPTTTIGWQIVHVATSKVMYHEYAFGGARLTFPQIEIPSTPAGVEDRKSTRLNSSHRCISYAVFFVKKKKKEKITSHLSSSQIANESSRTSVRH